MKEKTTKVFLSLLCGCENSMSYKNVHFCYIPTDLYREFFDTLQTFPRFLINYVSKWAKCDFALAHVRTYSDLVFLKKLICTNFAEEYAELYGFGENENPRIYGWVRLWLCRHMRVEIATANLFN